jgi:hypothetical protein
MTFNRMSFEVLKAMNITFTAFWDVIPYSSAHRCQRFGGICYRQFHPWSLCQPFSLKSWCLYTKTAQHRLSQDLNFNFTFIFPVSMQLVSCMQGRHAFIQWQADWGFPHLTRTASLSYDTASIQTKVGWLMTDEWERFRKEAVVV